MVGVPGAGAGVGAAGAARRGDLGEMGGVGMRLGFVGVEGREEGGVGSLVGEGGVDIGAVRKMRIITANFAPAEHQQVGNLLVIFIRLAVSLAAFAWSNRAIHVRNGAVPAANGAVASQIASAAVCARIIAQSRRHRPCHHLYHLHHLRHQIHPADRLSHHCQPTGWALRLHLAWIKQRGLTASALAVCASRRHYLAVTLAR